MSTIAVNTITDASGGNTVQINGATPTAYNTMGRNLVINGAMEVAQRGTSATGITNTSYFLVDRFKTVINSAFTVSVEQSTDAPAGFAYSLKTTWTTAADSSSTNYCLIDCNLEKNTLFSTGNGTSSAKPITISFWVKSSITGNYAFCLQNFGSSRRSNVLSYTINSANTWEYKTITTTADTVANVNAANGTGLALRFAHGAGTAYEASTATEGWQTADVFGFSGAVYPAETTNATWYITGVQLEVGSVATEFERRPYGTELALCQRYCIKLNNPDVTYGLFFTGACGSTTDFYGLITGFNLRATPTVTFSSVTLNSGGAKTVSNVVTYGSGNGIFAVAALSSGLTPGYSGFLQQNNTTSGYLLLSSEL